MWHVQRFKVGLWLIFLGSLWGVVEVVAGESLYAHRIPLASVWLTAWAVFVLGIGRGVLNKPGSSTVIGILAVVFKLVNAAPYFCHLLAIFLIGMMFDVFATLWMTQKRRLSVMIPLSGAVGVVTSRALFASMGAYVIRYDRWVDGGLPMIVQHAFVTGTLAAGMAALLVPLGFWMGLHGGELWQRRPRWSFAVMLVVLIGVWMWGRLAG